MEVLLMKANWCGFCQEFLPVFESVQRDIEENVDFDDDGINFSIFENEDPKDRVTMRIFQIDSYPTIIFFKPKLDKYYKYTGSRASNKFREAIKHHYENEFSEKNLEEYSI